MGKPRHISEIIKEILESIETSTNENQTT